MFSPNGAEISSPGLARSGYPGSGDPIGPVNPNGVAPRPYDRNPVGVGISMAGLPRVGAVRQPWALLHSPVGADSKQQVENSPLLSVKKKSVMNSLDKGTSWGADGNSASLPLSPLVQGRGTKEN